MGAYRPADVACQMVLICGAVAPEWGAGVQAAPDQAFDARRRLMSGRGLVRMATKVRIGADFTTQLVAAGLVLAPGLAAAAAAPPAGTVLGWGYNYYGQASGPAGLTGVTEVAAGDGYSLALKQDGT